MTAADRRPTVPGLTGLSVLARGGHATVFRAMQESVGRAVAVKVENRTLESDRDRRRFLREARAAGRMSSHPHVVDLFDAGVTGDGHPYLIMELCQGTYAERMKKSPLSPAETRDVGVKIADALADAHALGVLHRDVKPANILISDFGEPALADFGLAILTEARDISITLDVLTPAYAPPEMFRHAPPSPSADVYSLCATLYAFMHGRPPRWPEGRDPSLLSLVDIFYQPVPDLPGVPAELVDLLRAGLANDEATRPTAAELRDALLSLQLGAVPPESVTPRVLAARRPTTVVDDDPTMPHGVTTPVNAPRVPVQPSPADRPAPPPGGGGTGPRRRSAATRWWAAGLGVLVLLAAAITVGWYLTRDPGGGTLDPVAVCPLASATGARCAEEPECFADLATRREVPCSQPHSWETFALGELPPDVKVTDLATIGTHPTVLTVCSPAHIQVFRLGELDWLVRVVPPTAEKLRGGERTFRCVAGKRSQPVTGAMFTPSPR